MVNWFVCGCSVTAQYTRVMIQHKIGAQKFRQFYLSVYLRIEQKESEHHNLNYGNIFILKSCLRTECYWSWCWFWSPLMPFRSTRRRIEQPEFKIVVKIACKQCRSDKEQTYITISIRAFYANIEMENEAKAEVDTETSCFKQQTVNQPTQNIRNTNEKHYPKTQINLSCTNCHFG